MIITNKNNLPSALVNLAEDVRTPVDKQYSTTTILKPTRIILLERRYFDEIEQDVSDMIWLIFGTAVHSVIEAHDKTGMAEMAMEQKIVGDYKLTGKLDLYNEETFSIEDYKTASVWKVKFGDFDDWKKQGLIYSWLIKKLGRYVKFIKFHAILKDWTARDKRLADLKGEFYPDHPVWTYIYEVSQNDILEIEDYILNRFDEIINSERLADDKLPLCTDAERWYTGDKYAVYKKGGVRALRVLDTEQEANDYMANKGGDYIEKRKGENRRCQDY